METAIEAFGKGYAAMSGVTEDLASKDILKQAYAGVSPESIAANPQDQQAILGKAATLAGQRGLNSLSYSFNKQASELGAAASKQQLAQLQVKQEKLGYANQLVQSASNQSELISAIGLAGVDEPTQLQLADAVKRFGDTPEGIDKAKAMLTNVSRTADQNLKAQQLTLSAAGALSKLDNTKEDNLRQRLSFKAQYNLPLTADEMDFVETGKLPGAAGTTITPTADASSTGRGAAESGNDYSAVNPKSGAMGRYQITKPTLESLRKIDPSLPKTDAEFLKDPAAQDKAMKLLETEDKKSLKADGFKDSKVNLATYHRFGAPDGKKVLSAFEDNPSMPLKDALGEKRYNTLVEQNPDLKDKTVSQAITQNFGKGSKPAEGGAKEPVAEDKLMKQYDEKRGGGLTIKEWDTINPTAVQIGKEYKVKPTNLASATTEEKKSANAAYQVSKLAEDNAQFIKEHPNAVGTLAAIFKSVSGKTGNLADNVSSDKRYTGEVAELGKRLFALGLKDAAASAGGRMNVYLEKSFAGLYDQSQSDRTLLRIIKARQEEAFNVLRDTYGADKENLDKSKYGLAFAPDADAYVTGGKGKAKETTTKPTRSIGSFFKNPVDTQATE